MKILLLYPPPWKIAAPGEEPYPRGDGPPKGWERESRFCGDELTLPYGLLTLAAEAKRAGHEVNVLNLYAFAWRDVERVVSRSQADLYGLSCFTSNRRGTLSTCRLIRRLHPRAFIIVGGPHASALSEEMLEHCEAIDGVVIGEGESTFMEILEKAGSNRSPEGTAGVSWRCGDRIETGPPRKRIQNLDSLAAPYDHCRGHILITSRGCPGKCTFCGSSALWHGKVKFHSAEYVLRTLERMVRTHGVRYINVKDDTFTAERNRVLQICDGIVRRDLRFLWSCDTRVDFLDEEVLHAMRAAGCQMISLGVESASPEILKTIRKETNPQKALEATRLARQFGFHIRYYMMACNRGETAETLKQSLDFIAKARPNEYLFSFLTLYPGTEEFEIALQEGRASKEMFFKKDKYCFSYFPDEYDPQTRWMIGRINSQTSGRCWEYGVSEREKILRLFPSLPATHMDLAKACLLSGDLVRAEECIRRALALGFPLRGLAENYMASIRVKQGDIRAALDHLAGAKRSGHFLAVDQNLKILQTWIAGGGLRSGQSPDLVVYHEFETTRRGTQPVVPAPITMEDPKDPDMGTPARLTPVQ